MANGWFCIWRKIEDNVSWSRGMEYRGLMITILQKANWKQGFFMGQKVEPGQFPTSSANLATELKISRQKCQRMVSKLSDDGFISVSNVSNRFTMITVINWDVYQSTGKRGEQPPGNHRATGEQPPGTIEQGNKETREQEELFPEEPKKKKATRKATEIEYPDWLDRESFDGFIEHRKEIKHPATPRAIKGLITKLDEVCGGDHYLQKQIIEKSIVNGWRSFFKLKDGEAVLDPTKEEGYMTPQQIHDNIKWDVIERLKKGVK